ncbi:hypothetical protein MWU50_02615 [Flavobacteriaceae bacterium S0862]|nr:hypothetical protein [Flavobacteriaceae bacterium S0862]
MKKFIKILSISSLIAFVLFVIEFAFDYASNVDIDYNWESVNIFGLNVTYSKMLFVTYGYYVMYSIPLTIVNSSFFDYLNKRVVWNRYKSTDFQLVLSDL